MPNKIYAHLPTLQLGNDTHYLHPPTLPEVVHLDDPIEQVMVDYRYVNAATIEAHISIDDALIEMKVCTVPVLLVIDHEGIIIGLISAEDALGAKPVKVIQDRRLHRTEITVSMIMTPRSKITAIDMEYLRHAKVGNLIETLQQTKSYYAVAVKLEPATQKQVVLGAFSLTQISRQLGKDITSPISEAHSIAELQHDLLDS